MPGRHFKQAISQHEGAIDPAHVGFAETEFAADRSFRLANANAVDVKQHGKCAHEHEHTVTPARPRGIGGPAAVPSNAAFDRILRQSRSHFGNSKDSSLPGPFGPSQDLLDFPPHFQLAFSLRIGPSYSPAAAQRDRRHNRHYREESQKGVNACLLMNEQPAAAESRATTRFRWGTTSCSRKESWRGSRASSQGLAA